HYLVAHKLVDDAAVSLDDAHRFRLDAPHDLSHLLGVEALIHRGVPGEIGEQDSGLAALARDARGRWFPSGISSRLGRCILGEQVPAFTAESAARSILKTASRAREPKGLPAMVAVLLARSVVAMTVRALHRLFPSQVHAASRPTAWRLSYMRHACVYAT